jgi:DNA modification methylase
LAGIRDVRPTGLSYAVLLALGVPVITLWGGNYYADALPASRCWLVWDKENTGSFADAELAWTNQDAIVRLLRHQWSGLIKASERGERRVHPTQKPVALAEWVLETLAPRAKTAIDLFLGSGSTLIACENRGVACYGVEMSEPYVDVIINRWQNFTGLQATLDGKTFAEVQRERLKAAA